MKKIKKLFVLPLLLLGLTSCTSNNPSDSSSPISSSTPEKQPVITEGADTFAKIKESYLEQLKQFTTDFVIPGVAASAINGDFTKGTLFFFNTSNSSNITEVKLYKYFEISGGREVTYFEGSFSLRNPLPLNWLPAYNENKDLIANMVGTNYEASASDREFVNESSLKAVKEKIFTTLLKDQYDSTTNVGYMNAYPESDKPGFTKYHLGYISNHGNVDQVIYIKEGTPEEMLTYLDQPENYQLVEAEIDTNFELMFKN